MRTVTSHLVIGIDFGSDSVRALVVDARDGSELSAAVRPYRRWADGRWCDPARHQFRQHPSDHLDAMHGAVQAAVAGAGRGAGRHVAAIGVDCTGSSPLPVGADGTALALDRRFADDPDAMCILWKDHTAIAEAERINLLAHDRRFTDYTRMSGGAYSPEWFWAKIAHVVQRNPSVARATHTWMEHCDWIPFVLAGGGDPSRAVRSRCAAGHKAMWNQRWGGLPDERFLTALAPRLAGLRSRLYQDTVTIDREAGRLSPEWASAFGVPAGIPVASGALDAHLGAVGAGAAPRVLVKVMGTSTCDMLIAPASAIGQRSIRGISGQVDGSIVPGFTGLEAGQSAFGDVYAWFRRLLAWPLEGLPAKQRERIADGILPALEHEALRLQPMQSGIIATDWFNGRRTPDADPLARGAIAGLHLGHSAPAVYRALIEATAFGSRAIVDRFTAQGVRIDAIVAIGGIARRSPLVMQTCADVLGRPISVLASDQSCALGSAMAAATVAGLHPSLRASQQAMRSGIACTYRPRTAAVKAYATGYARYQALGRTAGA